ncbi:hypothetical protein PSCLAVI8L_130505 [Pseudoclavibacter sp. 8L]|nr:hypothetical protein PSCLAVI8L_130505 [Pseudoclavibacter sp. 8L]
MIPPIARATPLREPGREDLRRREPGRGAGVAGFFDDSRSREAVDHRLQALRRSLEAC